MEECHGSIGHVRASRQVGDDIVLVAPRASAQATCGADRAARLPCFGSQEGGAAAGFPVWAACPWALRPFQPLGGGRPRAPPSSQSLAPAARAFFGSTLAIDRAAASSSSSSSSRGLGGAMRARVASADHATVRAKGRGFEASAPAADQVRKQTRRDGRSPPEASLTRISRAESTIWGRHRHCGG